MTDIRNEVRVDPPEGFDKAAAALAARRQTESERQAAKAAAMKAAFKRQRDRRTVAAMNVFALASGFAFILTGGLPAGVALADAVFTPGIIASVIVGFLASQAYLSIIAERDGDRAAEVGR